MPLPVTVVQTGLDGSYRLEHVVPGSYYVVVTLPGYLSPIAQFTHEQLAAPTPETQQKITATVPTVEVRPNGAATADVRLSRGASIEGTLRFDDGSPYPGGYPSLMKRDEKANWQSIPMRDNFTRADDQGRYRIVGLAPGEYTVMTQLDLKTQTQSAAIGWIGSTSSSTRFSIRFYTGDTARQKDAKSLMLADGQALNGQDITIPVSKLHARQWKRSSMRAPGRR